MKLKSKSVLFCGNVTEESNRAYIQSLLAANVKFVLIANDQPDTLEAIGGGGGGGVNRSRIAHFQTDLAKIANLEELYKVVQKKRINIIVNSREITCNASWEDAITKHINSMICSTLMAIKHLGTMNRGPGGTVLNNLTVAGGDGDEYASVHGLLNDLDRSFADPYYFNNTGLRILTMCIAVRHTSGDPSGTLSSEDGDSQQRVFLETLANAKSFLQEPTLRKNGCAGGEGDEGGVVEEFEISVRN